MPGEPGCRPHCQRSNWEPPSIVIRVSLDAVFLRLLQLGWWDRPQKKAYWSIVQAGSPAEGTERSRALFSSRFPQPPSSLLLHSFFHPIPGLQSPGFPLVSDECQFICFISAKIATLMMGSYDLHRSRRLAGLGRRRVLIPP